MNTWTDFEESKVVEKELTKKEMISEIKKLLITLKMKKPRDLTSANPERYNKLIKLITNLKDHYLVCTTDFTENISFEKKVEKIIKVPSYNDVLLKQLMNFLKNEVRIIEDDEIPENYASVKPKKDIDEFEEKVLEILKQAEEDLKKEGDKTVMVNAVFPIKNAKAPKSIPKEIKDFFKDKDQIEKEIERKMKAKRTVINAALPNDKLAIPTLKKFLQSDNGALKRNQKKKNLNKENKKNEGTIFETIDEKPTEEEEKDADDECYFLTFLLNSNMINDKAKAALLKEDCFKRERSKTIDFDDENFKYEDEKEDEKDDEEDDDEEDEDPFRV